MITGQSFLEAIQKNPVIRAVLSAMPALGLPDCWLVAGSLTQTYWNVRAGRPAADNINDYDLIYFDESDTTWEAEDAVIKRVSERFSGLDANIETRNQARVPIWYPDHFGAPYPPTKNVRQAIDRYPFHANSIGVSVDETGQPVLYAPFGLDDIENGIIRCNPALDSKHHFAAKARNWQERFPFLTIIPLDLTIDQ